MSTPLVTLLDGYDSSDEAAEFVEAINRFLLRAFRTAKSSKPDWSLDAILAACEAAAHG